MNQKKSDSTEYDIDYSFAVGKIVGFRGLKGELKVLPSTNSPQIFLELQSVKIAIKTKPEILSIEDIKVKGKTLFVTFKEYTDRTSVEPLKGKTLYTQEEQLLELDSGVYWSNDLIGLKAQDVNGEEIGTICDVFGDEGEFLEVALLESGEKKLVPFVNEIVPDVDLETGIIKINPPQGLFD